MAMTLFTATSADGYPRRHMPQPKTGNGPWGEAIRYWLKQRDMQQADLMRAIRDLRHKTTSNTISNASRGLDCHTKTLRIIATALNVSVDEILVSPSRQSDTERRKLMIQEITERVVRTMSSPVETTIDQAVQQLDRATEREKKEIVARQNRQRTPIRRRKRSG